jgi:hypothetical protein
VPGPHNGSLAVDIAPFTIFLDRGDALIQPPKTFHIPFSWLMLDVWMISINPTSPEEARETRNTTMPHLVTEYLVSSLGAIGHSLSIASVRKNTREVMMRKEPKSPWVQSPEWLPLRVALHTI